ncbi:MAG: fumarylacetoacetate hydrolase family protein [Deltaproteobacteria bacterium]|jgi:2-keto-4-pentenoate hydratase|nr:fumarylacetoacetate hydrolase family protein [Deltaproteobacteria bacterium]
MDNSKAMAEQLYEAEKGVTPVEPLTVTWPGLTIEQAYAIQLDGVAIRRERDSRKVVGKKIGLTSIAMQKLIGVNEPDYGHLFDSMLVREGEPVPCSRLLLPKVEGEVAFVLKRRLKGPGVTIADVLRATEGVMASIEIVDSRVRDWKIKLEDSVADNASSARFVVGSRLVDPAGIDLRLVGMVLEKNGEVVNTGAGAAVLGHPAASVAWLANKIGEFGIALEEGEIILSGALTAAVDARAGDSFLISFGGLGTVGVRFV